VTKESLAAKKEEFYVSRCKWIWPINLGKSWQHLETGTRQTSSTTGSRTTSPTASQHPRLVTTFFHLADPENFNLISVDLQMLLRLSGVLLRGKVRIFFSLIRVRLREGIGLQGGAAQINDKQISVLHINMTSF
jgi:hypothetical protein